MFMWFFSGNRQEDFQPNKITVVCINSNKTTTTKKKEKSKHSFQEKVSKYRMNESGNNKKNLIFSISIRTKAL